MATELYELDALAQGAAVRAGEVSPLELVDYHLDRIARYDGAIDAFVTVTAEQARERARTLGAAGTDANSSPLAGVPTAIKDLVGTAGVRTSFGSVPLRGFVPELDGASAALIGAAGMISLGKTNLPEFAASPYSDNDLGLSTRSPWDLGRTAGGSSGGAAAAVSAGLVPVAHGTDGAGSIRIPASACGVFGLKASRGRVSNGPLGLDITGLSCHGPLARSVRDAAALLDVLAVPQTGDPYWAPPLPPGESFLAAARRYPGRLRIATYADWADPYALRAYQEAIELLCSLGHEVEQIANPLGLSLAEQFTTVWSIQQLAMPVPPQDEGLLRPMTRWLREKGRGVSGEQLHAALAELQLGARRALAVFEPYDAILTPTLAALPPAPEWFTAAADRAEEFDRGTAFSPYTALFNLTGQPSASLPLHWTDEGVPVGVMLTGRPAGEAGLLSLCAQVEAAQPWAHRRPVLPEPAG
jgi:amidase